MDVPLQTADEREPEALEGLLRWYAEMGVDAPVDEVPHDRFTPVEPSLPKSQPAPVAASAGPGSRDAPAHASSDALVAQAEALAAAANSIDELHHAWATLPGCNLSATATSMIFAGGTIGARVMMMADAPTTDDERQGAAFCGLAGELLDAMLRAIGLHRGQVYVANVVPWRPPGGRPPTPLELGLCLPFARRHIGLASPDILICLGDRAARSLLRTQEPITRLRGRWLSFESETATIKTLATFSPDYLLKQPLQKRRSWLDLLMLKAELNRLDG